MPPISSKKPRLVNEETRRAHRRQAFWQIFLPLLIGIGIAITFFVLVLQGGASNIERSAQTATILLAMPILISGLVFLTLVVGLSIGLGHLMKWLPPRSYQAQKAAHKINSGISQVSNAARQPFLMFESWGDAVNRVFHRWG